MSIDKDARHRIRNMIPQGVLVSVQDALKVQTVAGEFLAGEALRDLVRPQWFGFTSTPPKDIGLLAVFPHGDRSMGFVLGVADHLHRPVNSPAGASVLYSSGGVRVTAHANGDATVEAPGNIRFRTDGVLRLEGDGVEIHGRSYIQTDVHGKGQRETWAGGNNYFTDGYTAGAVTDGAEHGPSQPAVDSDYWEFVEGE